MTYRRMSNNDVFTFELGYFTDQDPSSDNYVQHEKRVANFSLNKLNRELVELHVVPQYQEKGIASLMLEYAKELGATGLRAEVNGIGLSQDQLIQFFERHNFVRKKEIL